MKPAIPTKPICDFCKSPDVVTCFLTTDRTTVMFDPDSDRSVIINSDPHWVACEGCAKLIRARSPQLLANRSYEFGPKVEEGISITLPAIIATQSTMFWPGFKGDEHALSDHDTE
jgi:hypothetical protein